MHIFDKIYIKMYFFATKRKITAMGRKMYEMYYDITHSYSQIFVPLVGIYNVYYCCDFFIMARQP
jgi:hypothetical protein